MNGQEGEGGKAGSKGTDGEKEKERGRDSHRRKPPECRTTAGDTSRPTRRERTSERTTATPPHGCLRISPTGVSPDLSGA
jgi:hypothetical protein